MDKYIGGEDGIEESQFTREVLSLQNAGVTEADIWINSKGGLWSTSVGIVSAMNISGIKFTTYNMGFADSSAGHIFQAGHKRVWMPQSLGLIHEIQGNVSANVMEAMNASVATMLCEKTTKTADEVRLLMKENTMMDADMAKSYGFCDEVGKTGVQNILKFTNSSDAYEAGQNQIKNLLPKNKVMSEVNALLGLTNEANEASQLKAINTILEAKNAAETALATKETELFIVTNALTEANGKLLVAETNILNATNAAVKAEAATFVAQHKGKQIPDTADSIEKWTNAYIADPENTKALIAAVNFKAPDHMAGAVKPAAKVPTTVHEFRASLMAKGA